MENMKKIQGTSIEVTTSNLSRYVTRLKKALADEGITIKHTVAEKVFAKAFGSRNPHEFKALLASLDTNASQKSSEGIEIAKLAVAVSVLDDKDVKQSDIKNNETLLSDFSPEKKHLNFSKNLSENPFAGLNLTKTAEIDAKRIMKEIYKSSYLPDKIDSFFVYINRYKWLSTGDSSLIEIYFNSSDTDVVVKCVKGTVENRADLFNIAELKMMLSKYPDNPYLAALFIGLFHNLNLFDSLQMKNKIINRMPSLDVVFNKVNRNRFFQATHKGLVKELISKKTIGRWGDMYSESYLENVLRNPSWTFDDVYIMRDLNYNPLCVLIKHPTEDAKSYYIEVKFFKSGEVKVFDSLYKPHSDFSILDEYTLYQLSQ